MGVNSTKTTTLDVAWTNPSEFNSYQRQNNDDNPTNLEWFSDLNKKRYLI